MLQLPLYHCNLFQNNHPPPRRPRIRASLLILVNLQLFRSSLWIPLSLLLLLDSWLSFHCKIINQHPQFVSCSLFLHHHHHHPLFLCSFLYLGTLFSLININTTYYNFLPWLDDLDKALHFCIQWRYIWVKDDSSPMLHTTKTWWYGIWFVLLWPDERCCVSHKVRAIKSNYYLRNALITLSLQCISDVFLVLAWVLSRGLIGLVGWHAW